MTPSQDWRGELYEMFDWTDFTGNIGSHALVFRDSYDDQAYCRSKVESFIESLITAAEQRGRDEAVEYIKAQALRTGSAESFRYEGGKIIPEGVKLGDYVVPEALLEAARSNSKEV